MTEPRQFSERQVPPSAFRLPIECQFNVGKATNYRMPFSMLARSSEPVMHWYWGALYHDFDGMQRRDSIAVDYCHDDAQIIGVGNQFTVKNDGLHIAGELISTHEGDRAYDVAKKSAAGVPYEASIDFRGDNILAEEVPEGRVSAVNGRQVEGPALIFRQWSLRGVAVCPHGMDQRTSTQFSQGDEDPVTVRVFSQPGATMAKTPTTKPSTDTTPAGQQSQTSGDTATGETGTSPAAGDAGESGGGSPSGQQSEGNDPPPGTAAGNGDEKAQWRAELKRFTDRFGTENGTKWYTENKTYTEGLELHCDEQSRQLAAKDQQIGQLSEKLKSLHHGEETPATLTEDPGESNPDGQGTTENRYSHMGRLGTFASSLKLPTKKSP
jgi:hypothetical protein